MDDIFRMETFNRYKYSLGEIILFNYLSDKALSMITI